MKKDDALTRFLRQNNPNPLRQLKPSTYEAKHESIRKRERKRFGIKGNPTPPPRLKSDLTEEEFKISQTPQELSLLSKYHKPNPPTYHRPLSKALTQKSHNPHLGIPKPDPIHQEEDMSGEYGVQGVSVYEVSPTNVDDQNFDDLTFRRYHEQYNELLQFHTEDRLPPLTSREIPTKIGSNSSRERAFITKLRLSRPRSHFIGRRDLNENMEEYVGGYLYNHTPHTFRREDCPEEQQRLPTNRLPRQPLTDRSSVKRSITPEHALLITTETRMLGAERRFYWRYQNSKTKHYKTKNQKSFYEWSNLVCEKYVENVMRNGNELSQSNKPSNHYEDEEDATERGREEDQQDSQPRSQDLPSSRNGLTSRRSNLREPKKEFLRAHSGEHRCYNRRNFIQELIRNRKENKNNSQTGEQKIFSEVEIPAPHWKTEEAEELEEDPQGEF